ncbi:MAG: lipid-A-disaccharide synthase [Porticoccaceae bacterium]
MSNPLRIGVVVGEASGDQLGAGLLRELKRLYPEAIFEGIGGPKMQAQGFRSLFPMERLSVMGLVEPLKRLPELLGIRRELYQHFLGHRFDLVVGIDSPDFNLGLELKLRKQGIKTAHYVSPSVWAWRQGRIKKIARAVDLMITLFPFEADFYRQHQVSVACVGHPLAEEIPIEPDTAGARAQLGIAPDATVLTLMPGSRGSEVEALGRLFLETAMRCQESVDNLQLLIPAASDERRTQLATLLEDYPDLPCSLLSGQSHLAMSAADAVLLSSGTSALEAMLLKKPMVVSYRLGKWTYALVSRMLKVDYVSLPNLLAKEELVPELLQEKATIDNLNNAVKGLLLDSHRVAHLKQRFTELHLGLRHGGSEAAARALSTLIEGGK